MIRITQLKLKTDHTKAELETALKRAAGGQRPSSYEIIRRSIDARKKPDIYYVYTIDAEFEKEKKILSMKKSPFAPALRKVYSFPDELMCRKKPSEEERPVIVGFGPAGIFAGLILARAGYCPVIYEKGGEVDERADSVKAFFEENVLDPESNVAFGEGGAGTFSDGKLNTLVKDRDGMNRFVLEEFVRHGADEDILYDAKPHIGTDRLRQVVASIREEIKSLGGEIHFHTRMTGIEAREDLTGLKQLKSIEVESGVKRWKKDCRQLILAIGHSARDTFAMLHERDLLMEAKPFAIGVRVQHPARMINESQYGEEGAGHLPPASYKLTHQCKNGRGVYTFCMCPGGYVINASTEEKMICVNGMSYHDRGAINSNSAVITTVRTGDFGSDDPLAGIEFQRKYERLAYAYGMGRIPVQLFSDFRAGRFSIGYGDILPCIKGDHAFSNIRACLPDYVCDSIVEGMAAFGRKISGFDRADTLLCGVETRTSSPVRIRRGENYESSIRGIFPCGEGAGYAGGISSAAMDGIRIAQALAQNSMTG